MGEIELADFLQPHQFVGYWGYGSQSVLETDLTDLLNRTNAQSAQPIGRSNSHPQQQSAGCIWGVAYVGLAQPLKRNIAPRPPEVIAALSASGLGSDRQADGTALPDAWVKIHADRLILGREPFGRVPLYWTQKEQVVWFASRLGLLLPLLEMPQISIPALYGYSCLSYVPTPLTPVVNIAAVPAGIEQEWVGDAGRVSTSSGRRSLEWQESPTPLQDEATAISQLQTLLQDAVQRQIIDLGDEPVGVFLSGGLDSSIVAALLVQAGVKVRAYTLDFGSAGIPEYPYAEQVAEFLNIPLTKVDASPRCVLPALLPAVQALDLPFGDGVTVPLFLLSRAASQETRVIFNGEGGDQLFAGWANKPLIAAGVYEAKHPAEESFGQQYLRTFHRLWGYEDQLFQAAVSAQVQQLAPQDWLQDALAPNFSISLLHRLRRANLMLKGAQNIQPRATALGFAHGLMVRSPFCDLSLAQWVFQLAPELHLQGSCEKYILKRAAESWLPPEIIWRPKRGMGVPLTAWCLNEMWHELGVWLNPKRLRQEGIWEPHVAVQIAAGEFGTLQGRRLGESLWLLLMWQVWRQAMLKEPNQKFSLDHPFWLPSWLGRQYLQCRRRSKEC
jgi:asparagine synthase (glutamine-hydrolysing)